jgi:hypothetical protein
MKSYDIKLLMYLILVSFVCSSPRRTTFMVWQKYIHVVTYTNYGYLTTHPSGAPEFTPGF